VCSAPCVTGNQWLHALLTNARPATAVKAGEIPGASAATGYTWALGACRDHFGAFVAETRSVTGTLD
jgi:hypothetical protein